jgi:type II secretory pathway pseudopilin PulG
MLEMTLALAISSIFLTGIYMTFIQISKANRRATTRLEALRSGRAALQTITNDLKHNPQFAGGQGMLFGVPHKLPYGDGVDNSVPPNLKIDENIFNGTDDDSLTTMGVQTANDRHALIPSSTGNFYERPERVGKIDLGDANVGMDVKFGQDFLRFKTATGTATTSFTTYFVGSIDGLSNVLLRRSDAFEADGVTTKTLGAASPLAFDVLGFDLLYWNSNAPATDQYWLTSWNSANIPSIAPFTLPASVYVRLTLRADPRPSSATPARSPVETIVLTTIVNIETVIGSASFQRPTLP